MATPDDLIRIELKRRNEQIHDLFDDARAKLEQAQARLDGAEVRLSLELHKLVDSDKAKSTDSRPGRERILEHARALFLERGFLDVSMREIAEASGLRKASIYHHFRDKEELFTAIVLEQTIELRHRMAESIEGVEGFRSRLERLTETQLVATRSHSMRLAEDFKSHIPENRHEEMHEELRNLFGIYESVFADAHAAGEITNIEPSLAASCFFQIVLSLAWDWLDTGGATKPEPEALADLAVKIVLFGVAAPGLRSQQPE